MSICPEGVELRTRNFIAAPASDDILYIEDVSDGNKFYKISIQQLITLVGGSTTSSVTDTHLFSEDKILTAARNHDLGTNIFSLSGTSTVTPTETNTFSWNAATGQFGLNPFGGGKLVIRSTSDEDVFTVTGNRSFNSKVTTMFLLGLDGGGQPVGASLSTYNGGMFIYGSTGSASNNNPDVHIHPKGFTTFNFNGLIPDPSAVVEIFGQTNGNPGESLAVFNSDLNKTFTVFDGGTIRINDFEGGGNRIVQSNNDGDLFVSVGVLPSIYNETFDGSAETLGIAKTITHNLGNANPFIILWDLTTNQQIIPEVISTGANTITVTFYGTLPVGNVLIKLLA